MFADTSLYLESIVQDPKISSFSVVDNNEIIEYYDKERTIIEQIENSNKTIKDLAKNVYYSINNLVNDSTIQQKQTVQLIGQTENQLQQVQPSQDITDR